MSITQEKQELKASFDTAYNNLNDAQKEAVDTIEGPVMVIAGPGTGKTQILTLRIANILLKTDTDPSSILAITFTDSGAKAMRTRLQKYIGARAYQVPIYTFHGFADRLIREYPDAYDRIIGGKPATEIQKISIIESILDNPTIKKLRPSGDPSYYVRHILRIIADLKKEYITPDGLAKIVDGQEDELANTEKTHTKGAHKGKVRGDYTKLEQVVVKNRELIHIYRHYQASLREAKLYDFEDMIAETVVALSNNEDMVRDLQEQYQYVLADEHQDVNGAQNKILELLASYHDSPNIFVVGDEKQAIYRFQGASLTNFMYFQERFMGTKVISLTDNYRSGQIILDAAHSLVAVEDGPLTALRIPLLAQTVEASLVTTQSFAHTAIEDSWVVESIVKNSKAGIPLEEIAVIVRTNKEVEALATQLRKAGMQVAASADGDILQHPITHTIEALISVVVTTNNEEALFTVLHGAYWGLSLHDVIKICSARSYSTTLLSILSSSEKLAELGVDHVEAAMNIVTVIETARARSISHAPHRVLEYLLQESGFLAHVMKQSPFEGVRIVRRIYDEVESLVQNDGMSTLQVVRDQLAQRRLYGVSMEAPYIESNTNSVKVMTAHKSKGLEFEVVYIPHLQDNNWGGGTNRTYFTIPLQKVVLDDMDSIDDEKRLLYVAMTRAKTALHFSSASSNTSGKTLVQSRLITEIDDSYVTEQSDAGASDFNPINTLTQNDVGLQIDSNFITSVLRDRGFSATSFNNYLKNPWDYIYRNVLRVPEVQPAHMQFGTAVHSVLEYVTKNHTQSGTFPSDTVIKQKLETALGRLPLSTNEFVRLLDKGLLVIYPYIDHMKQTLTETSKEELNIKTLLQTGIPEFPELPLTGKLDRVDIDARGNAVRVLDYKTGKPKTRNDIEGKTASSDGAYKRQLVFYALLLKLNNDERYQTNTCTLSFVEPDAKGVLHEETFTISDAEVEVLTQELIDAVKAIIKGDYIHDQALAETSNYAHYISLLRS
ncbi:MAG: ATP-dependent DNA helicase [Patescibacteria group bacterium]